MAGVKLFTDLLCWQDARGWSKSIFFLTKRAPFADDKRLVSQINDSSESVMANIAEGFGRGTQGEFIQFLGYSLGSLNETQSHLCAAYDREYLSRDEFASEFRTGTEIRKKIIKFMTSMVKRGSGVKHLQPQKSFTDELCEIYTRVTGKEPPKWVQPSTPATT